MKEFIHLFAAAGKWVGIVIVFLMIFFTGMRILFYLSYPVPLTLNEVWSIMLGGIRFDLSAIAMLYAPFILLSVFPLDFWYRRSMTFFFYVVPTVMVLFLSLLDLAWYSFTHKRTSRSSFEIIKANQDIGYQLWDYVVDYYYLFILFFLLLYVMLWVKRKYIGMCVFGNGTFFGRVLFWLVVSGLLLLMFRGGIQLKPISSANASEYASPQKAVYVLNTPFVFLKSLFEPSAKKPEYYSSLQEAEKLFSPVSIIRGSNGEKRNVIFFILESFSREYMGYYNPSSSLTPFLDSLMRKSTVYEGFYANSLHSLDGVTTLLTGVPAWLEDSYITSPFSVNVLKPMPWVFKKRGYATAFFHGSRKGSMSFDLMANILGFDRAYFYDNYPDKSHYDGTWGVYDHYFLQYMLNKINDMSPPFFVVFFSLSSHHPYKIPSVYAGKFPKGTLPIHESIAYADYAVRLFFEKAKSQSWFYNTLFVFTADHTSVSVYDFYNNPMGVYSVPFFIYEPRSEKYVRDYTLMQQTDVYPTLLQYMQFRDTILAWGKSVCDTTIKERWHLTYKNQTFLFTTPEYYFYSDYHHPLGLYKRDDSLLQHNLLQQYPALVMHYDSMVKALLFSYHYRLLYNKMTPDSP